MRIMGTAKRPRLCVFRSNKHIYAQIINDEKGVTLAAASDADLKEKKENMAYSVGEIVANRAAEKKIKEVVFDRGGYLYAGQIKAVSEGARKGGLIF